MNLTPTYWYTGPNKEQVRIIAVIETWTDKESLYLVQYEAGEHRYNKSGVFALTPDEFSKFSLNINENGFG